MEKIEKVLESIGLNEKEIKIYLASLLIGQSPASILGNKAGINRTTAQYICNQLVDKKLITSIQKGNTFLYSPEDPEKIINFIGKEYNLLEKKMSNAREIIGELKSLANPKARLPKVKYYTGVDGIIEMFEDVLKENKTLYGALNITDDINPEIEKYLNTIYTSNRIKSSFKAYMLFNSSKKTLKYSENDTKVNRISILVNENDFPFDSCIHLYSDKIAMYSYKNNDLVGVIIKNDFIFNSLFSIFKLAWNFSKKLPENEKYKNIEI